VNVKLSMLVHGIQGFFTPVKKVGRGSDSQDPMDQDADLTSRWLRLYEHDRKTSGQSSPHPGLDNELLFTVAVRRCHHCKRPSRPISCFPIRRWWESI